MNDFLENGLQLSASDLGLVIDIPHGMGYKKFHNENIKSFNSFLETNGYIFYSIKHDLDIKENGELKREHYHYVICSPRRRRLKTYLLEFLSAFNCNMSASCIKIARVVNLDLAIQYLIHKNNPEKFLYDEESIISNDLSYRDIIKKDIRKEITASYLEDLIVVKKLNDIQLADLIGANKYLHYLPLIRAIQKAYRIF